jgi:hypothetical protein
VPSGLRNAPACGRSIASTITRSASSGSSASAIGGATTGAPADPAGWRWSTTCVAEPAVGASSRPTMVTVSVVVAVETPSVTV